MKKIIKFVGVWIIVSSIVKKIMKKKNMAKGTCVRSKKVSLDEIKQNEQFEKIKSEIMKKVEKRFGVALKKHFA